MNFFMVERDGKKLSKILLIIIIFTLFLKIGLGFHIRSSFLKRGNSHTPMNALAINLVHHGEYAIWQGTPSVDYEPLYSFFMALAYKIFGINWLGLTLFQALLVAGSTWLLFKIGTRIWNVRAGFIAAVYYSFYPYLFSYSLSVYDLNIFIFLIVLLIYLLLNDLSDLKTNIFIGMVLGLAFLTRASIIALLPALFLYFFYKTFKISGLKGFLKRLALLVFVFIIVIFPWLLRNYLLTGQVIISTHGPFGFWQGNNQYSYELLKKNISLDEIYRMKPPPPIFNKYRTMPRSPKQAITVADAYRKEALDFIKKNPGTFVKLALLKFVKFWSWVRNPSSSKPGISSNQTRQIVYFISYFPLLIFFPIGLFLLYNKKKEYFFLFLGILFFYTLAHMIVMGFTRLRLPIDPILMISSGIVFSVIFDNLKNPQKRLFNRILKK